jgi:hypothetical protein
MTDTQNESGLSTADLANAANAESDSATNGGSTATMTDSSMSYSGSDTTSSTNSSTTDSSPDTQVETRPAGSSAPLFDESEAQDFRDRWQDIQAGFVDDPKQAVQQADGLVADVIQRLAQVFADERNKLEDQWSGGGDVDTESLRKALQTYRSFFDRLLSV